MAVITLVRLEAPERKKGADGQRPQRWAEKSPVLFGQMLAHGGDPQAKPPEKVQQPQPPAPVTLDGAKGPRRTDGSIETADAQGLNAFEAILRHQAQSLKEVTIAFSPLVDNPALQDPTLPAAEKAKLDQKVPVRAAGMGLAQGFLKQHGRLHTTPDGKQKTYKMDLDAFNNFARTLPELYNQDGKFDEKGAETIFHAINTDNFKNESNEPYIDLAELTGFLVGSDSLAPELLKPSNVDTVYRDEPLKALGELHQKIGEIITQAKKSKDLKPEDIKRVTDQMQQAFNQKWADRQEESKRFATLSKDFQKVATRRDGRITPAERSLALQAGIQLPDYMRTLMKNTQTDLKLRDLEKTFLRDNPVGVTGGPIQQLPRGSQPDQ